MNTKAERWSRRAQEAQQWIPAAKREGVGSQAWWQLQRIIDTEWPDISFGLGQRIVLYHYYGNQEPTVANCLAVRQAVFDYPDEDIRRAAEKYAWCLRTASAGGELLAGDDWLLEAMYIYNWGHSPVQEERQTLAFKVNSPSYKAALIKAKEMLA